MPAGLMPDKTLDAETRVSLPVGKTLRALLGISPGKIRRRLTPLGEDKGKLVLVSPGFCTMCLLPLPRRSVVAV